MRDTILFGDCRRTLCAFLPKSARMCVTSPPYYGLRDYGGEQYQLGQEQTPEKFIENLVNVFRQVKNVLTDDGTLWVNLGDSIITIDLVKVRHILNNQYLKLIKIYQKVQPKEELS
jgi:DNA modification methylase